MININMAIKEAYDKWKDKEYIYEKSNGIYVPITYGEFIHKAQGLAKILINDGLKNKKILIFGDNSTEYMIADIAVFAYVGISVNISSQTGKDELEEIIKTSEIDAILYDSNNFVLIEKMKNDLPNIRYICIQDAINNSKENEFFEFNEKNYEECSKIFFSSGTTSKPKGVMLSLKNIFSGWEPLQRRTPFCDEDIAYLFLPLHHTYGNIYNFIFSFLSGLRIYLCSSIENIENELKEVNPTIFCAVPLIYRKIYVNNTNSLYSAFGSRIKYLYCGGTIFAPDIRKAYKTAGLPMFEAYALTETASSFSIEYPNNDDFESVGTLFENIEVKIINADEEGTGDITVKGDNVFLGYINNKRLTDSVFTQDGYFITGDYGYVKNNKLYIKGRKNNIIISENGENVFPIEIESMLKKYDVNIIKVKAYLKDNKINYNIYIKNGVNIDIENIIYQYNSKVTKKDRILYYTILNDKDLNFKEKN